jgi:SAM-dependent methyltransferase
VTEEGSAQRDFFREVERDYWAGAEGLKDEERALVERHLDPDRSVLDAGTGGGRIARALHTAGFAEVTGFDFAPELIDAARAAVPGGEVHFDVADATALPYADAAFDQALYLQQVISTIDDPDGREAAMREARRVVRSGGTAIFSFVCFEARERALAGRAYLAYIRSLRAARRDRRPTQSLPRIRTRGRLAAGALRDRGPYNWWYRAGEAQAALAAAGFAIDAIGFAGQAADGALSANAAEALTRGPEVTLYAVCRAAVMSDMDTATMV